MTATPEEPTFKIDPEENKEEDSVALIEEVHPLYNIFKLGYATSPVLTVFSKDEVELKVTFRTLQPSELIAIIERSSAHQTTAGQLIQERIETLAHCVVSINHMPLALTKKDRDQFFKENKRQPSPLEEARIIFNDKIESLIVIDSLYEAFSVWNEKISKHVLEAKKNLKN